MDQHRWVKEFSGAVTVCDPTGVILEMNDQAMKIFQKQGGAELLGSNLLDCHPEPARTKLKKLMAEQRENVYTIEKNSVRRMVYQTPWYSRGEYRGIVEITLSLPPSMPHFVRDNS